MAQTRREWSNSSKRMAQLAHTAFDILKARCVMYDAFALEEFVLDQEVGLIGTLSFMITEAYQDFLAPIIELSLTELDDGSTWLLFKIKTSEPSSRATVAVRRFEKAVYATRGNIDRWHVLYDVEMTIDI
jgi:hypothetical protein